MRAIDKKTVAVAMSGGVDSSTTAYLLKKSGYNIIGVFMRLGNSGEEQSEAAARQVCQKLHIKFYPLNLEKYFKKEIIKYFLTSYKNGLTPNPCVKCNQFIKFGELLKISKKLGADYLATGHYAKIKKIKTIYRLLKAKDKNKDQTYFLYNLTQQQLASILFPLGDYTKNQIRKIANKAKLPYLIKESQDICFLSGDHNNFLRNNLKLKKGKIKTFDGQTIGAHQGLPLYTIGQRRGVEIGGTGPYYVAKTDYQTNTLYVVNNADDPSLFKGQLLAKNVNWLVLTKPKMPLVCQAVIRYRHQPVKCEITRPPLNLPLTKGQKKSGGVRFLVKFVMPQRAVTPGQSVVFYQGNEILGGGVIAD